MMGNEDSQEHRSATTSNCDQGFDRQRQTTQIQDDPWRSPINASTGEIWIKLHYHMPCVKKLGGDHHALDPVSITQKYGMETGPSERTEISWI